VIGHWEGWCRLAGRPPDRGEGVAPRPRDAAGRVCELWQATRRRAHACGAEPLWSAAPRRAASCPLLDPAAVPAPSPLEPLAPRPAAAAAPRSALTSWHPLYPEPLLAWLDAWEGLLPPAAQAR
jgi:hypothetical protein